MSSMYSNLNLKINFQVRKQEVVAQGKIYGEWEVSNVFGQDNSFKIYRDYFLKIKKKYLL